MCKRWEFLTAFFCALFLLIPNKVITFAGMNVPSIINRGVLLLFLAAMSVLTACHDGKSGSREPGKDSTAVLLMEIQKCSRLYTTEYHVRKIITHADDHRLKGKIFGQDYDIALPMSRRQVAIPVEGTLKAYVDLGAVSRSDIVRKGKKIEIVLPDPQIELTSTRIDHDEVRDHVGLLRSRFTDEELTSYSREGRKAIADGIAGMDLIPRSRESAANVIIPLLTQMGYSEDNITVTFRHDLTPADLIIRDSN